MGVEHKRINGYDYMIDTETGTVTAKGDISVEQASRNPYVQRIAGGENRQPNDDGGHIIASAENGSSERINVVAQNRDVNRGIYRDIERQEMFSVKSGNRVHTEKIAYMDGSETRPSNFIVNDTVTDSDGNTQHIHFSMTNMSNEQQEETNTDLEEYYKEHPDELDGRDYSFSQSGMERDKYDRLMIETEGHLPTIKDEYNGDWIESHRSQTVTTKQMVTDTRNENKAEVEANNMDETEKKRYFELPIRRAYDFERNEPRENNDDPWAEMDKELGNQTTDIESDDNDGIDGFDSEDGNESEDGDDGDVGEDSSDGGDGD